MKGESTTVTYPDDLFRRDVPGQGTDVELALVHAGQDPDLLARRDLVLIQLRDGTRRVQRVRVHDEAVAPRQLGHVHHQPDLEDLADRVEQRIQSVLEDGLRDPADEDLAVDARRRAAPPDRLDAEDPLAVDLRGDQLVLVKKPENVLVRLQLTVQRGAHQRRLCAALGYACGNIESDIVVPDFDP